MKKIIFLLSLSILFLSHLFSARIDKTILEGNETVYDRLLEKISVSNSLEKDLQKTLVLKIKNLNEEIKKPEIEIKNIKNQKDFINTFFNLTEAKVSNELLKEEIKEINEELEDLKENIDSLDDNATNLLTLELQYAYFYKRLNLIKKVVSSFENSYQEKLKTLLGNLKNISFKNKDANKTLSLFQKKIDTLEKERRKFLIKKERYKFLNNQKAFSKIEKRIENTEKKIDKLRKSVIKIKLSIFFEKIKNRKDNLFENINDIKNEALKLYSHPSLYSKTLEEALNYTIQIYMGESKAYIYKLKEQIIDIFTKKSINNIPLYKFAGGLGIFLIFLIFRKLFAIIVIKTLHKMAAKTKTSADDKILRIVSGPLKFTFIIIGLYFGFQFMGVFNETIAKIIKTLIMFSIFWLFYESVLAFENSIYGFAKKFGRELYREIGAFFVKTLKIFVVAVGTVAILQEWNINVSAFIASLGLGGLAFALAAKDTAANLFGGLSILADNALKIDDWIKVGSVEGTVEEIGLRTTKIRTFEKSLVTVPNQIIANNPIENFSRREIRRIKMRVGLTYSTSRESMQKILQDIKNMLKNHPGIDQNATMLVNFDRFEDSSLSIFIYTFTNTAVWAEYMKIREDVHLKIMEIIERYEDSDFAFPSQSLYVEKLPESKKLS